MSFKPLQDRVLVLRIEEQEVTPGGIIIPDGAKEKPQEGVVISHGGRVEDISVNDRVLFSKYAGTEVNLDGTEHLIIRQDDILGILK